jgi:hypothetical protein
MKKVRLSELSEAVRLFLTQAMQSGGVEIEDETGRVRGGFVPYRDPTTEERRQAQAELEKLWQRTGPAMQEAGVSEADIDRDLQEDD